MIRVQYYFKLVSGATMYIIVGYIWSNHSLCKYFSKTLSSARMIKVRQLRANITDDSLSRYVYQAKDT